MKVQNKEMYGIMYPDLQIKGQIKTPLTKYGLMRKNYLEYNHPVKFNLLLLDGTLYSHCKEVERQINHQIEIQIAQIKKKAKKSIT